MKTILSLNSHVASGYVGNRAAVLPLQLMGFEVLVVNTVQFSNHPGHPHWTGQAFGDDHIRDILNGLKRHGTLEKCDAVISGYCGRASLGALVLDTVNNMRSRNPDLVYCCDPVMGDSDKGLYVAEEITRLFRDKALYTANIITPNLFELCYLTGKKLLTQAQISRACLKLHEQSGPATILVTSIKTPETPENALQVMVSDIREGQWLLETPELAISPAAKGTGDLLAALFLGHRLAGEPAQKAMENSVASIFGVLEKTKWLGWPELALIPAQDCIRLPTTVFKAEKIL